MLRKVAVFSKESNPKTIAGVSGIIREFCSRGISILLPAIKDGMEECHQKGLIESFDDLSGLEILPDLVLSVGGDGTFLETAMKVREMGIPVAGVNTGRLGFLANIPENEISKSIDMLCNGEFEIIERTLLSITRPEGLFEGNTSAALNEITIQNADLSMITIHVYTGDIYLNTYWSDGLIISTATGSTAYNLSVGGPILTPGDESIIISPIAPHNLTIRPIVLGGTNNLRLVIEGRSREFLATCDFRSTKVPFTEEIHIMKDPLKLKTVTLNGMDFYNTLRSKLMWGADRRN